MNLLYPDENDAVRSLSEDACQNLAMEELVDMIGVTKEEKELLRKTLSTLPASEETVIFRQEILRDLMEEESLCPELEEILKNLEVLREFHQNSRFTVQKRASLWELIDYMEEMEIYIRIVEELNVFFQKHPVRSRGLREMAALLQDVVDTDRLDELKGIVKSLRADISTLKSVVVAINLTPELHPEEVIVMDYTTVPFPSKFVKSSLGMSIATQRQVRYREPSQFMKYICDNMEKHLSKMVQKHKAELRKYVNFKGYFLLDICNDLKVYLMMAKFGQKLQREGHCISFPVVKKDADAVRIRGIYNVRLTKKQENPIVKNDFTFSKKEKIFILTGPNRGGKTMLTQALGITALLAAGGWFVTADAYEGYLFEDILTHFPADENKTLDMGRLGEEAVRIQKIVKMCTPKTMVLLNETYSSTSSQDGLYLAKDLLHILKDKGVPTVFNTHIHALAGSTEEMNAWEGESEIISLTMEMKDNENTYRVLRGQPDAGSFARSIALKYGVTYEQFLSET